MCDFECIIPGDGRGDNQSLWGGWGDWLCLKDGARAVSRKVGPLNRSCGHALGWGRWQRVLWKAQVEAHTGALCKPNQSHSHVHWVTLMEEASNEPFTAVTCTANLLPASR